VADIDDIITGLRKAKANAPDEDTLARAFVEQHGQTLRYVAVWGQWMQWNGQLWREDTTLHAYDMIRDNCRDALDRLDAKTVAGVERLARADRRVAATSEQWDTNPWVLNTPDGIIDLRTGQVEAHDAAAYCARITAVSAPIESDCPLWEKFLERVTDETVELQNFLQRVAGYALTGSTEAHALFFAYGTGANGKSVFINTLTGMLGDYASTAPMETFTASHTDRHPTELADLRGKRLVTAQETEEGRRWAESRIKALTGGDKIKARFMRQDFFEFAPQFKLLIAGNHKPALRGVDEAVRRRWNLIPFTVTIPPSERDEKLVEKLRAEWPGILRWAVDGCLAWQAKGLAPPAAVREATAEYLEAEDAIRQWIEERCDVGVAYGPANASALFASWRTWAEAAGEWAGSQKRFSQALLDRGFRQQRTAKGMQFLGIELRA
jgi:P4 family phage/plasmid primase-like protien